MLVRELIELLELQDPEFPVLFGVEHADTYDWFGIVRVEKEDSSGEYEVIIWGEKE